MEVILRFFLLLLFVKSSCGFSRTVYLSGKQTWNDASHDSTCAMLGLDLTGDLANDIDNISSTVLGTHQTAWIGAYVERVWINFQGCFYGIIVKVKPMTSPGDPAKECLRYCNFSGFALTGDKCVCYNSTYTKHKGCLAKECSNTKYTYCGQSTLYLSYHCLCYFMIADESTYTSEEGDCLAVTYSPKEKFFPMDCSVKYRPVCYDPSTSKGYLSGNSSDWLESLSDCYNQNKQFANRTTSWTGNHNGTYWVGGFAVTYTLWGHPPSTNDGCVAVNITNNHLIPVVLPCDTSLPALCVNTSLSTQITTELSILDTTSIITTDGVTANQQITNNIFQDTTSNTYHQTTQSGRVTPASITNRQDVTKSDTKTTHSRFAISSSATYRQDETSYYDQETTQSKRSPTPVSTQTSKSTENITHKHAKSSSTSPELSFVPTLVGSVAGGVAMLIIIVVVILLLRRRGVFKKVPVAQNSNKNGDILMRNTVPDKVDHIYTEVISTSDTVYNHLGELKTKHIVPGEDLYDHTGDQSETYGQLHTHNNRYEDDSEYDHTFTGISDGTYEQLHAGKGRGGDDVYDHTGGSGNPYDHIYISKHPPEVESDYDHTRNT